MATGSQHSDSLNETRCGLVGNLLMCRKFAALLLLIFLACLAHVDGDAEQATSVLPKPGKQVLLVIVLRLIWRVDTGTATNDESGRIIPARKPFSCFREAGAKVLAGWRLMALCRAGGWPLVLVGFFHQLMRRRARVFDEPLMRQPRQTRSNHFLRFSRPDGCLAPKKMPRG